MTWLLETGLYISQNIYLKISYSKINETRDEFSETRDESHKVNIHLKEM